MSAFTYEIDSTHSHVNFSVRHLMVSNVRGSFKTVSGRIVYDPANPSATEIDATIDVTSISTGDAARDGHVLSPDFLDAAAFPTMTFAVKEVAVSGDGATFKGDLTLHGVTKEVVLDVEGPSPEVKDPWGNFRIGASATAKISRKDFGLVWNAALETGGVMVSDEVKVTLDIEAVRKAA